ncbi:hypothetical protein [Trinickia fusca]|uniref:Lipoprotein n=1 Tax=Trinickia fusca TaxID=2419777 RepID=A0A494XD26_9BURK|nr:hypothetical protein D7S89_19220 [Trinickia fusca]
MKTKCWAAMSCCALVAACAPPPTTQVSPETMQIATAPLVCKDADECALWWRRAHDWVSHHASYKLRSETDTLIETAGPAGGSGKLAYEITKTPGGDGSATIGFAARCDSMLGCDPNPWKAGADFKLYVRSGTEPPPGEPGEASPPPPR